MNELDRRLRATGPLLLLGITLLGGALRFYAIGSKGLWLDEAFSVWLGWQRLPEMWNWIARIDQHPPLYYTLLNLWMWLGDDAATVRMLSAVAGTLTIPLIYAFGRRLAGRRTGMLAALLLAVSPFNLRFSQEARMYALLALVASAAMLALTYLLSERPGAAVGRLPHSAPDGDSSPKSWRDRRSVGRSLRAKIAEPDLRRGVAWAGYVVFTAAAMLTHSTALLLLVGMNLFVFGLLWLKPGNPSGGHSDETPTLHPPALGSWLIAQAGVLLLWGAIWLPAFVGQARGVYREFWMPAPGLRTVVDALGNFLSAHLPRQQIPWLDAAWILFTVLFVLGIVALRRRPGTLGLLLTLFLTPLVGELIVSLARPIFYDRTLIWATIPLYVLLAAGMASLRRWLLVLAVALLLATNAFSLNEYFTNFEKEGWREAAADVGSQIRAGDLLLFNASWVQIPFDFYFREQSEPVDEHGLPVDLFDRGVLEPTMTPEDLPHLRELIAGRERVWLVYSHNWYTDPERLIPAALAENLTQVERHDYEGLEIRLYESDTARAEQGAR